MKRVTVFIDDQPVEATVEELGPDFLEEWARLWQGRLPNEEDEGWDWARLIEAECSKDQGYAHFGLKQGGLWQCAMITRPGAEMRAAGPGAKGVYIEYLSSAPWNRKRIRDRINFDQLRVKPAGMWLVWQAILQSRELDFDGRAAWHSLEGAIHDYMLMIQGLTNLGPDEEENGLPWLEVQPTAATTFIGKAVSVNDVYRLQDR